MKNWRFFMLYENWYFYQSLKTVKIRYQANAQPYPKTANNQTNQIPSPPPAPARIPINSNNLTFDIHRQILVHPSLKYPYYNTALVQPNQPDKSRDTKRTYHTPFIS